MESGIFRAGVEPGGPVSEDEIKLLICYILSKVGCSMSFAQFHLALEEKGLVNYFELVRVVDSLKKTGHLQPEGDAGGERYTLTYTGRDAAENLGGALSPALREKALKSAEKVLREQNREAEVTVKITGEGGGYRIELAIPEAGGALIAFSLFAPNWEECSRIRRRFLDDPLFIYKGVVALLTGDRQALGKTFHL